MPAAPKTAEFALIARYFERNKLDTDRAALGIGDDCALINPAAGMQLALSTDTLVEGTHFFPRTDANALGHKALAVNLSDLAAMGAIPRFVLLALTLPAVDDSWLSAFAEGFFGLAQQHDVALIGGDTTRGPLAMTLTVIGEVEAGRALRRDRAQVGDDIWVSGELGAAALAVATTKGQLTLPAETLRRAQTRLDRPTPRVELGRQLLPVAHAAIDLSDGLLADLGHIAERSQLQAVIDANAIPVAAMLDNLPAADRLHYAVAGGDDYELCFTAPAAARGQIDDIAARLNLPLTRIGAMQVPANEANVQGRAVVLRDQDGNAIPFIHAGFDHFSG